jgi:hypothetical protein
MSFKKPIELGVITFDDNYSEKLYESLAQHYRIKDDIHFYFPFIEYFSQEDEFTGYDNCFNNSNRLLEVLDETDAFDENNTKFNGIIRKNNMEFSTPFVVKRSPVLNFENIMLLKKQLKKPISQILEPSQTMVPFQKFTSFENSTFIDTMVSYMTSKFTEHNICPHFPLFYGYCLFTEEETAIDISDDLDKLGGYTWFSEDGSKKFYKKYGYKILQRVSDVIDRNNDDFSDDSLDIKNTHSNEKNDNKHNHTKMQETIDLSDESDLSDNEYDECEVHTYAMVNDIPVQLKFMEYCGEDNIDGNVTFTEKQWESILFQVIYTLYVAYKYYKITHNDLHLGNILFKETNEEYLYYKIEGHGIYRIPTFGYIVKIIDWNRATFKLNDVYFANECFERDGDCYGQFIFPEKYYYCKNVILPNEHTDLALLAASIIDEGNIPGNTKIYELVKGWCTNEYGVCVPNKYKKFKMYEQSSRCRNSDPSKLFSQSLFSQYKIRNEELPEGIIPYCMNK